MNAIPQISNPLSYSLDCAILRIGAARVEPRAMSITIAGRSTKLEPKAMQVLLCFAARPGQVVTRDEVMAAVWSDVAVTDDVLNRATSMLRRAFGDDARAPRFIETVPKVGYRLVAPVEREGSDEPEAHPTDTGRGGSGPEDANQEGSGKERTDSAGSNQTGSILAKSISARASIPPASSRLWSLARSATTIAAIVTVITFAITYLLGHRVRENASDASETSAKSAPRTIRVAPLISEPGRQADPALSGDGTRIAYASETSTGGWDLFVRLVDGGPTLQLTSGVANERGPVWSPDGSELAWIERTDAGTCRIVRAPSLGGVPRSMSTCPRRIDTQMAWKPDGHALVVSGAFDTSEPHRLWRLDLDDGEFRPLTTPANGLVGDTLPAFSPSGDRLAFVRWQTRASSDVYVMRSNGSQLTRVTHDDRAITGLGFGPDGDHLISISNRGGQFALWRTSIASGESEWLGYAQPELNTVSLSRDGTRIVVAEDWVTTTVTRVGFESSDQLQVGIVPPSNERDWGVALSADGREVIWVSDRSGTPEIWSHQAGEDGATALTNLDGPFIDAPRLAPDGASLLFEVHDGTETGIYVLERGNDRPRRLTPPGTVEQAPSWSHDGTSVLFASSTSGSWQVWRRPLPGDEQIAGAEQVTRQGGFAGFASADGRWLYFTRRGEPGMFRRAMAGGPITRLFDDLHPDDWRNVSIGASSILYLTHSAGRATTDIRQFVVEKDRSETRATVDGVMFFSGLALAPDERSALLSRVTRAEADLMLLENAI